MPLDILKMYNEDDTELFGRIRGVEKQQLEVIINEMRIIASLKSKNFILTLRCEW